MIDACNSPKFKSYIKHENERGFKTYISMVRRKGGKKWVVHNIFSGPTLTKASALKSAQQQFLYDNATVLKLAYPRKVQEYFEWKIIKCVKR
jgi:hypothetical protein